MPRSKIGYLDQSSFGMKVYEQRVQSKESKAKIVGQNGLMHRSDEEAWWFDGWVTEDE